MNKFLALVCILREYSFNRQGVIDFNFLCFREAIHKVFEIRTTKKCTHNDILYDDEDDVEDEEDVDDDDDHDGDDDEDDIDGRSGSLQRYDSEDNNTRVNN